VTSYLKIRRLSKRYNDTWALALDKPSEGIIQFDGVELNGLSEKEILMMRRRMGFVFQNPTVFKRSVYENVAYGLKIRGEGGITLTKRVEEALHLVGLSELESRKATTLSGGEAQRLALIRTTIVEPELLLLDEPTANLDPANVALIEDAISEIVKTQGTTIVIATHNMFQAERLADRVGFLLDGELIEVSGTDQLFRDPRDERTRSFVRGEMVY